MTSYPHFNFDQAVKFIQLSFQTNNFKPLFFWEVLENLNIQLITHQLGIGYVQVDFPNLECKEDFLGYNYNSKDSENQFKVEFEYPEWFPDNPNPKGILHFKDFNQAFPDVQNAAISVLDNYKSLYWNIPEGWLIVATGQYPLCMDDSAKTIRFKHCLVFI